MPHFEYQARDGRGELSTGVLAAASLEDAGRMLRADGKFVVKLAKTEPKRNAGDATGASPGGVKRGNVILFAQQLSIMVETGVPLSDALDCAAQQTTSDAFRAVLRAVCAHVQGGGELSAALRQHPRVFPTIMTSLIRAGKASGTMSVMLERIANYMSKEHRTLKQARGALMYPLFMLVMAIGVTVFLLGFVLPKFAKIYENRHAVLPAPTRLLLAISHGLIGYWYLWVALLAGVAAGFWVLRRIPTGRRIIDFLKLNTPVLGRLFRQLYLNRACRTMGTMLSAGVAVLDMVAIVRQVTNNIFFDDLWDEVDERSAKAPQLSEPLFASELIPKSIAQMIYSGEKSGRLGQVMTRVAEHTEAEFDQAVKTATQFIEPVIIAFMGCLIGFVAISLLLPIFSVGKVMAGG